MVTGRAGRAGRAGAAVAPGTSGRRRLLTAGAGAGLSGLGALLGACATGGGSAQGPSPASGEAAPAAQLRKGATVQWAVDNGPTRTPLRQEQLQLFKERVPDVNVELLEGATGTEKLQTLFAAGTPPDMLRQETPGMAYFASRGQLAALDPFLRRDRYDLTDFFPAAWELWAWQGRHYGLPFLGVRIVYFNRALATAAGGKAPPATWKDPAWTFDAFLDTARRVAAGGSGRWGYEVSATRRDWQPWVWSNGGELFNPEGTKLLLEEPPAVEALHVETPLIQGVEADRVLTEELGPAWRGERTLRESLAQAATRLKPLLNP